MESLSLALRSGGPSLPKMHKFPFPTMAEVFASKMATVCVSCILNIICDLKPFILQDYNHEAISVKFK
jgi:hypothetical protein